MPARRPAPRHVSETPERAPRQSRRRRPLGRALLALAMALALWSPPNAWAQSGRWRAGPPPSSRPTADAIAEARERNAKALKLYQEEGAVEAALAEIQRAYDLAPSHKLLYNLGQMARTARDYALALHAFERYLADGADAVTADRRRTVQEEIRELRTYVSSLTVEVDVSGAEIYLDDASVGTSPLDDPVVVNAGRLKLRAQKGARQASKSVVVAGGDELRVRLSLGAAPPTGSGEPPAVQPSAAPDTTGRDDGASFSPYLWIGWTAAGLMGVGAAVTGGLALGEAGNVRDARYAGAEPPDDVADQQQSAKTLAITTDVLIGVAAAAFVVTTALAVAGVGGEPAEEEASTTGRWSFGPLRAASAATAGDVAMGLTLERSF